MVKYRSIRIAVNLCLTGAFLLPGTSFGKSPAPACDSTASKSEKCEGCGQCTVSSSGERCGCCCQKPAPPAHHHGWHASHVADHVKQSKAGTSHGVCFCGTDPQPAAPASQSRAFAEQLVKVRLIAFTNHFASATDALFNMCVEQSAPPSLLPRDSQRLLCVWRI